jgi:hypothetical protein
MIIKKPFTLIIHKYQYNPLKLMKYSLILETSLFYIYFIILE